MNRVADLAAETLAIAMAHQPADTHAEFLREVIMHAAGGLLITEGGRTAAEWLYRAGDAAVSGSASA